MNTPNYFETPEGRETMHDIVSYLGEFSKKLDKMEQELFTIISKTDEKTM